MLEGFKKIVEGVNDIIEPLNPMVTDMTDANKTIAKGLLDSGFSVKQIQDFVDVSRNQLDEFIEVEVLVIQRMKEQEQAKAKA